MQSNHYASLPTTSYTPDTGYSQSPELPSLLDPATLSYLAWLDEETSKISGPIEQSTFGHSEATPMPTHDFIHYQPPPTQNHDKTTPQKRKWSTQEQRVDYLRNDEYVMSFSGRKVFCSGCKEPVKLDSRRGPRHYLGNWFRHRKYCPGIKGGKMFGGLRL